MGFSVVEIIEAKVNGKEHNSDELSWLVGGFTRGEIPDYQMSAWLMAVRLRGMTDDETIALTKAMVDTGRTLDLSNIPGIKLDKHSSGGVGDKVTLAFVPILAAAGVKVVKMSGRGLGHTGGTLDKLESIPGFLTELTESEIYEQVKTVGACICAQTEDIAPADKLMYALRDVTGTVASIPLIASSIMSKKIACGADVILLDIKVGSGAFMKTIDEARSLAELCVKIGKAHGKRIVALLTDMNQPLGRAVGNGLEVHEALALLNSQPNERRFWDETMALCNEALQLADSSRRAEEIIGSDELFFKFDEIISAQHGSLCELDIQAKHEMMVTSPVSGYVVGLDALQVGKVAGMIGAGRQTKSDTIDHAAGIRLGRVQGEWVGAGQGLAILYASDKNRLTPEARESMLAAYTIGPEPPEIEISPILGRVE